MKTKKSLSALLVVAIVLLVATIAIGITGAYYQTSRTSVGSIILDQGLSYTLYNISVDDNNQLIQDGSILYYKDGTGVSEYTAFQDISVWQNESFYIATPYITANENTLPFYLRAKIEYTFYSGTKDAYTEITNATVINDLKTQLFNKGTQLSFTSKWVEKDGWHYYVEDANSATKTMKEVKYGDASVFVLNYNTATATVDGNQVDRYYSNLKTGEWFKTGESDVLYGGPETTYNNETIKLAKMGLRITVQTIQVEGVGGWAGATFTV